MSASVLEAANVWKLVSQRRILEGCLPVAKLERLLESLAGDAGEIAYELSFGEDAHGQPGVEVRAQGEISLLCQRSLEPFAYPIAVATRVAFLRKEADEAALAPGNEPRLVAADGLVVPAELIEDELILALPVVALSPRAEDDEVVWRAEAPEAVSPFAALRTLRSGD